MAALGLGLAALGRPGYMTVGHAADLASTSVDGMARHLAAMCSAAYVAGVRHFDTARSYGRGEAFLRDWLEKQRPADVTVSTKWGYRYTAGWSSTAPVHEVKDHGLAHLDAQWPESRATLGPWFRVLQVHSATLESGVLDDAAVLKRLAWLRGGGLQLGLSVTGARQPDIIRKAIALTLDGARLFDWVQATWNVLEPSAGDALAEAHALGVKVIVKEGLANGRLSARGDVPQFVAEAATRGVSPDALALATALAQPWASVVLMGAATLPQLESNLHAVKLEGVDPRGFARAPGEYWAERAQLAWS
jgi:aryl-alcohol dehydrogenase-like predicted oxidoreductase